MFYIEVQDRYYKATSYKNAVEILATFSFSERSKSNKQYRDSVAKRFKEVLGKSVINTENDRKFIESLVKAGDLKIRKTPPRAEKGMSGYKRKRK